MSDEGKKGTRGGLECGRKVSVVSSNVLYVYLLNPLPMIPPSLKADAAFSKRHPRHSAVLGGGGGGGPPGGEPAGPEATADVASFHILAGAGLVPPPSKMEPQAAAPSVRSSHSRYLDIIRKSRVIKAAPPAPNHAPNSVAAGVAGASSAPPGTHFAAAAPHQQWGQQLGSHKLAKSPQGGRAASAAASAAAARPGTSSDASSLASMVQCLLALPELQRGGKGNDTKGNGAVAAASAVTSCAAGGRAAGSTVPTLQSEQAPFGTAAGSFHPPASHSYEAHTQPVQRLVDEGQASSPQRIGPSAAVKQAGGGGSGGLEGAAHRGEGPAQSLRKDTASKAPSQQRKLHSSWGPKPVASERRCVSAGSAIGVGGGRQLSAALSTAEARRRRGEEATAAAAVAAIPPYRLKGGGKKAAATSASAGGPSSSPWVVHQVGGQCRRCRRYCNRWVVGCGRYGLGQASQACSGVCVALLWCGPGRPVCKA